PVEFMLVGRQAVEWTPLDSLTIGKYMAYDLGGHWGPQAFYYYLPHTYSMEDASELFPAYPKDRITIIEEEELETSSLQNDFSYVYKADVIDIANSFKDVHLPDPFN